MMNITICNHYTNCQNIDNELWCCSECGKYKLPGTIIDRYGRKADITFKSIFYTIINLFRKDFN